VQANKAGLLEIADVFVVNKADRPGVAETVRDLELMLELSAGSAWRPPIIGTVATTGEGVDELWRVIGEHRAHLEASGELVVRRAARLREELRAIVVARLQAKVEDQCRGDAFEALVRRVEARELDPYSAADELLG